MSKILKKVFKKTIKTKKSNNYKKILFGKFGLQSLANGILTKRQLEAARRSISKRTKRICKLWIRVSLNKTITSKPKGVRMGKGKGSINQSVCYISRGEIVFELSQINKLVMIDAFNAASAKLPIPTQALSL